MVEKDNFSIGVLQVFINKLSFETKVQKDDDEPNAGQISFKKIENKVPKGKIMIQAQVPITNKNNRYTLEANVNGIFLIPDYFSNLIGKKHSNDPTSEELKKIRELASAVIPILFDKFKLISAQLSLENNNYPIFPNMTYDLGTLRPRTNLEDKE